MSALAGFSMDAHAVTFSPIARVRFVFFDGFTGEYRHALLFNGVYVSELSAAIFGD